MTRNYAQIVEALEMFAQAHPGIQRFQSAFFDTINTFTTYGNQFPIMYAAPQDVSFNQNTNTYRFRIYVLDVLQKDRSNQPYILLATSEILRDLVNWIRDPKNPLDIINNPSIITVNNFGTEGTCGWYMDLSISAPAITTECSLPFPGLEVSGLTCDYTYVTDFITCDDLSECPIIIDLQEQIDAIVVSADTFTVGGSYDNSTGTLSLLRNDGNLIPITGFTTGSTGPDIYVTGGTFNPSTETLTLTRNDNQPVIVTGFSQTDISGLVPYTGGIDNVTLDEFSFIVNTNQNQFGFIINDLTTQQQLVEIGQNGSGNGVINVWNKQNNLVTTIENGQITTPTISATTYLNLPLDIRVTGGTYSAGSAIFTNNTGGTFTVSGFSTGGTGSDTYVTGYTYNNANTFTIKQNQGQPDLNATINIVTGLTTDYFDFNTAATVTRQTARMTWNDSDGTLDLGLKGGNVTLQIGQEQVIRVVNKTGSNLLESNYSAVRISGAQGNRPKVDLAQANNDANSAETIGLVTENIDNNQEGFITTFGLVRGINTTGSLQGETWVDGSILYLSPTIAGRITNIKPVAPQHTVIIGYVINSNPSNGSIFVKVDNGYELDELHNVMVTGATNGQVLTYSASTGLWVPTTVSGGTGSGGNSIGQLTGDVTAGPASASSQSVVSTLKPNLKTGSFGVTVDGVSSTVQVGQTGFVTMPYSGTITSWSISANAVGSIQFDIWKAAGAIPTIANTIVASAFPTLTANQYISSSTTTGWSLTFNAGDVFGFYVNSASTIKNATLTLQCTRL